MMDMRAIFLIMTGSYLVTIQSHRVVVMERKFKEIIEEFHQKENGVNEQDIIIKTRQVRKLYYQKGDKQSQDDINHQNSVSKQGNINEQETFRKQNGIDAQDTNEHGSKQRQSGRTEQDKKAQDTGHAINCGPPGTKMNFTWEPKIVYPKDKITMTLDMIAPVDFINGEVCADIYVAGMTTPILHLVQKLSCGILNFIVPGVCPKGRFSKNGM
ncbi:hypothetical protein KUTeg_019482 [Tegillarca granosa]|uniref:Uncharacterized protein n=1 Tax=Tegillarca granosa TaxID=220873 RepID=A0ABQ9EGW9_TEGGR|nr:hypothetical protein KUTeg_019482 [Tegillarca granosa]